MAYIVDDIDKEWYGYGVIAGVHSRAKLQPNAERIENLGVQGIRVEPTNKQIASFFLGLEEGRRQVMNSLNPQYQQTTQTKKPHSINSRSLLTLALGEVKGIRGQFIDIPLYITNNRVDNRYIAAVQTKLTYDTTSLSLHSITKAISWDGTFVADTSVAGAVAIQGVKAIEDKEDSVVAWVRFLVKNEVPLNISELPINLTPVTYTQSGLLTRIVGDLYYIVPTELEHGKVLLESKELPQIGQVVVSGGEVYVGSGSSSMGYEFTASVEVPNGVSLTGGVNAVINIKLDGILIGSQKVGLQVGSKTYRGKVPLLVPSLQKGQITYEIVIEPEVAEEEGYFYVFIKAGALFNLETEVKREEVKGIEVELVTDKKVSEIMKVFKDFVVFETFKASKGGGLNMKVNEIIKAFEDKGLIEKYKQKSQDSKDSFTMSDSVTFTISKN